MDTVGPNWGEDHHDTHTASREQLGMCPCGGLCVGAPRVRAGGVLHEW